MYNLLLKWNISCSLHRNCEVCGDAEDCRRVFDKVIDWTEEKTFKI